MSSAPDPGLEVRRAVLSDADEIARTHVQAWRDAYPEIIPPAVLDHLSVEDRETAWRERLAEPQLAAWVVRHAGAVVGFASIGPGHDSNVGPLTAELSSMYLLAGYWGRGLGWQLMDLAFEEMIERGFEQAVLWVLERNTRARRFYEAAGWLCDGGRKDRFGGGRGDGGSLPDRPPRPADSLPL